MKTINALFLGFATFVSTVVQFATSSSAAEVVWLTVDPVVNEPWPGWSATTTNGYYVGGASPALYDELLRTNNLDFEFHYLPGIYLTSGWKAGERQTAGTNCVHRGAGTNTIIRLVDASTSQLDGVIFGMDYYRIANGFEIRDLVLDCNAENQPKWTNAASYGWVNAIRVQGNNLVFSNLLIKGFGTKAGECFPLLSTPTCPVATNYGASLNFSNILVDSCTFTAPASGNLDGLTCVAIGAYLPFHWSNAVVNACVVSNVNSDFTYRHGFTAPVVQNCVVDTCDIAVYYEPAGNTWTECTTSPPDYNLDFVVKGNLFTNVLAGVYAFFVDNGPVNDVTFGSVLCESNLIYLMPTFGTGAPVAFVIAPPSVEAGSTQRLASITLRYNGIYTNYADQNLGNAYGLLIAAAEGGGHLTNLVVVGNTIAVRATNAIVVNTNQMTVHYALAQENRGVDLKLHPLLTQSGFEWGTQQKSDFDRDTYTDIVFRKGGTNRIWHMPLLSTNTTGTVYPLSTNTISPTDSGNFDVVGTADFNLDCNNDLLWRQMSDGTNAMWFFAGTNRVSASGCQSSSGGWRIVATGDLNGDGHKDIVWRSPDNTNNAVWFMSGTNTLNPTNPAVFLPAKVGASWYIGGTGDFNSDGKDDILWRNDSTAALHVWYMDGSTTNGVDTFSGGAGWSVSAVGQFDANAKPDILWRNGNANAVWLMNGTNMLKSLGIVSLDSSWSVVGPK